MCLSPIKIKNPSKVISISKRDRLYFNVPCGHCAECQSLSSLQWSQRMLFEFEDCVRNGGYVLFDTLTYRNRDLPHVSRFYNIPKKLDFVCFDMQDVTKFLKRLRWSLGDVDIRYFISSEYGTSPLKSHRPHYHCLFFVRGNISPVTLSLEINRAWSLGRTDGVDYNGANYVLQNRVYRNLSERAGYLAMEYVGKYVQKSCDFQKKLDSRQDRLINYLSKDKPDGWLETYDGKLFKRRVRRAINQFHVQSLGFGASVLGDLDLGEVFRLGAIRSFSVEKFVQDVPLSTYYKRKLFQELVNYGAFKTWQNTELGIDYLKARQHQNVVDLTNRLYELDINNNYQLSQRVNLYRLADYLLNHQYVVRGVGDVYTFDDKLSGDYLFNYQTLRDKENFGFTFLSRKWLGQYGSYENLSLDVGDIVSVDDIPVENVKMMDECYSLVTALQAPVNNVKQITYELIDRLVNIYRKYCI